MKYGKLINNNLDIKEVEKGIEVGGTTTEQQLKEQGYKPLCEIEDPKEQNTSCIVNMILASCKNGV